MEFWKPVLVICAVVVVFLGACVVAGNYWNRWSCERKAEAMGLEWKYGGLGVDCLVLIESSEPGGKDQWVAIGNVKATAP